jgi:uncharacterized protein with ParB-like and HNH nuclease domain
MAKLESLSEIFNHKIFRVPDYQRGYSWEKSHLEALWQDIENLPENKIHYTGTLTVELIPDGDRYKFEDDIWLIDSQEFKPYYVVDGQQRLTTFIILVSTIIDKLKDDDELANIDKDEIKKRFLYNQNVKKSLKSYLFGYEVDDPSYEFFKTTILGQDSAKQTEHLTFYTSNLQKAKQFFEGKIKSLGLDELENIYKKITQKFRFDFNIIDKNLNIFLVFETMNNRGKHLSNLEILKNRLIYLSTLLPDNEQKEKDALRSEINDTWKTLYEYLGKDSKRPLNDDEFLRIHWIMFNGHSSEAEFYKKDILERRFTVRKLIDKKIGYDEIKIYVDSLRESVKAWYKIKNPLHAVMNDMVTLSPEVAKWLNKLHRLTFTMFEPLMLFAFTSKSNNIDILDFVKQVEKYIFVRHTISRYKRNSSHQFPYPQANECYKNVKDAWKKNVIEKLKIKEFRRWYFRADMNSVYEDHYYNWDGLKYFLHEYEENLQKQHRRENVQKVDWDLSVTQSIEHILPQTQPEDSEWANLVNRIDGKANKHKLIHSLGNLLLVSKTINSTLSNKSFEDKKKHKDTNGNEIGYFTGSYSEIEVSQYEKWDEYAILERGLKMLKFLEDRWNIDLGTHKDKQEVLLLDFIKMGKQLSINQ